MTTFKLPLIALGLCLASPVAFAAPLTFTVDGVEARGGTLYIGVQTEDIFMQEAGVDGSKIERPTETSYTFTYDLPEGEYAVSVWHDLDDDNVFDVDAMGMPTEGWAMINGRALRAAPVFDAVKITLPSGGAQATETITYPF